MNAPDLQRIQVRLYATSAAPSTHDLARVLHGFIQRRAVDEVLVDVADYTHVHEGPGVVLIAHAAQYSLGAPDGRFGLLYARKRDAVGTTTERFVDAIARTRRFATLLSADLPGLGFGDSELVVQVADGLLAPNDEATFAVLGPAIREAVGSTYALSREGDPRGPFTVRAIRDTIAVV